MLRCAILFSDFAGVQGATQQPYSFGLCCPHSAVPAAQASRQDAGKLCRWYAAHIAEDAYMACSCGFILSVSVGVKTAD